MARIFKIIGGAFVLLGVLTVGLMGIMLVDGPTFTTAAGEVWVKADPYSLGQFQVFVQRTLGLPDMWDNYVVPVLKAPVWQGMSGIAVVAFLVGMLFMLSARRQRRVGIIHTSGHMS